MSGTSLDPASLPDRVFSNTIKLMLERQKSALYHQEMPQQQAMLLERQKSTLNSRICKNHILIEVWPNSWVVIGVGVLIFVQSPVIKPLTLIGFFEESWNV